jgi:dTDP-4-dehydrorhamnose reductase
VSLLITGATGSLGREVAARLPDALTPASAQLDIRSPERVDHFVADHAVDTVIHCAARTSVRACEIDRQDAFDVNVNGTRAICSALAKHTEKPLLVYISTACVFPGDDPSTWYTEDDLPQPKNYYALTKLLSERMIDDWADCGRGRKALILRTNFADRGAWKHSRAFVDRFGTYLYPDLVAQRLVELMHEGREGIMHVCGDRRLSMLEFARLTDPDVGPTSLDAYDGPPVTVNMCLASNRIAPVTLR